MKGRDVCVLRSEVPPRAKRHGLWMRHTPATSCATTIASAAGNPCRACARRESTAGVQTRWEFATRRTMRCNCASGRLRVANLLTERLHLSGLPLARPPRRVAVDLHAPLLRVRLHNMVASIGATGGCTITSTTCSAGMRALMKAVKQCMGLRHHLKGRDTGSCLPNALQQREGRLCRFTRDMLRCSFPNWSSQLKGAINLCRR